MNKKYFLMVLLALVAWMGRAQTAPDTVTINFQLASKAKGETAGVLYPDFLTFEAPSLQPVTDSNGRWTVRIPTYRTLHVKVWDQNKIQRVVGREIHLFCRPGTETNILLDDINNRCTFTGENAEAHQAQVDHPLEIVYFNGKVDDMEIGAAAQSIRAIHELNLQRIDSLCNALPTLPDGYVEALRAIANYVFGKNMTENVIGHFQQNMGRFIEQGNKLPKEYVDLLHETETYELTHPNRWITRDAIFYFSNMMSLEALAQNGIVQEILDDEGDDFQLSQLKQYCSLIDALDASDEVKQMMKAYSFLKYCELDLTPQREEYLRSQLSAEWLGRLRFYINESLAAKAQYEAISDKEVEALAKKSIEKLEDGKDIFQKLIAPYRGHVVYVDFWGTWCAPCMKEMEHVERLHEALKGLPVTYMYFANKSPKEAWVKATQRFGLDGDDCVNLRLSDRQQQAVEEYLNIATFPTYLLVDTKGTIVNDNAPRPSSASSLREVVEKILHEGLGGIVGEAP